jgi:hypothetical protein
VAARTAAKSEGKSRIRSCVTFRKCCMHGMQGDLIGEHAVDMSCGIPVHCIADGYDGQPSTLAAIVSFEGVKLHNIELRIQTGS